MGQEDTKKVLLELFVKIDEDQDGTITREEAVTYWKDKQFGKMSVNAMFSTTDEDGGGTVSREEFMKFWQQVVKNGYKNEEIQDEARAMINGETWKDWNRTSITEHHPHERNSKC